MGRVVSVRKYTNYPCCQSLWVATGWSAWSASLSPDNTGQPGRVITFYQPPVSPHTDYALLKYTRPETEIMFSCPASTMLSWLDINTPYQYYTSLPKILEQIITESLLFALGLIVQLI